MLVTIIEAQESSNGLLKCHKFSTLIVRMAARQLNIPTDLKLHSRIPCFELSMGLITTQLANIFLFHPSNNFLGGKWTDNNNFKT